MGSALSRCLPSSRCSHFTLTHPLLLTVVLSPQACNPDVPAGAWITHIDIVEHRASKSLRLVSHDVPGKCGTECRTIARSCELLLGDSDTELAEALYRLVNKEEATVQKSLRSWAEGYLCRALTTACTAPPPPVPGDRPNGPPFEPKTETEIGMDKLMASLADVPGMPGMSLYSRDDLAALSQELGETEEGEEQETVQKTREAQKVKQKKPKRDWRAPKPPFYAPVLKALKKRAALVGKRAGKAHDALYARAGAAVDVLSRHFGRALKRAGGALEDVVEAGAHSISNAFERLEKALRERAERAREL